MALVNGNLVSATLLGIDNIGSYCYPPGEIFGIFRYDEDDVDENAECIQQKTEELEIDIPFGNIIVVYNLPEVPRDKIGELTGTLHTIINRMRILGDNPFDSILEPKNLWMPIQPYTTTTCGYYIIHCDSPSDSEFVMSMLNGYKLDTSHTLGVKRFDEFAAYARPSMITNTLEVNLRKWLSDKKGRSQFVMRTDSGIEVLWNDASYLKPDLFYKRSFSWTERQVQWSPLGTYLATFHNQQGAALWGSGATTFNLLMCCKQSGPQIERIQFSPGERFLVTYASSIPHNVESVALDIYDLSSGELVMYFRGLEFKFGIQGPDGRIPWPILRWIGGDDKYFAHIAKDFVSVYETETFTLIDGEPINVPNVTEISCSPTDPILALFVPQQDGRNQPATVSLVQIPSKEKLREEIIFGASDCKMYWQSNGDYLAVEETRSRHTGFVIFRIKEGDMPPVEVLEFERKEDKVIAFAWEPEGRRFAVIHDNDNYEWLLANVSFYSMRTAPDHNSTSAKVSKLATLKGMEANSLYWSPAGRFIVLANPDGQMVFYDVDNLETMATAVHLKANHIQWDPTGRYVATAVTSADAIENGFKIWSSNGKLLYGVRKDCLLQFSWRPRPPSLLTQEEVEELLANEIESLLLSERETHGSNVSTGAVSV